MEPPAIRDFSAVHVEKAKVFQAMRPLGPADIVRGQYKGYRDEPNVAADALIETHGSWKNPDLNETPEWQRN